MLHYNTILNFPALIYPSDNIGLDCLACKRVFGGEAVTF